MKDGWMGLWKGKGREGEDSDDEAFGAGGLGWGPSPFPPSNCFSSSIPPNSLHCICISPLPNKCGYVMSASAVRQSKSQTEKPGHFLFAPNGK